MVAKLNTEHEAVTSEEIYYSSGIPVVLALFFWTFYRLSSQTIPAHGAGPSAAEIVGIFVIGSIVMGFIRLRRNGARMELLVQDALSELRDSWRGEKPNP